MNQALYDKLVGFHRPPCDCRARGLEKCEVYGDGATRHVVATDEHPFPMTTHPAPAWVYELVHELLRRAGAEPDKGEGIAKCVLRWCQQGDPEERSLALRTLLTVTKGPRIPAVREYLHGQIGDPW